MCGSENPNIPPMLGSRKLKHIEKRIRFQIDYALYYESLEVCGGQETLLDMSVTSWSYFT